MRHLYGTALASTMIIVAYFAGAWGYLRLLRLPGGALPAGGGSLLSNSSATVSLAAVAVTGLLAGILIVVPWISPLAAGLPGLLFVGWTALYLTNVRRATDLIPLRSHAFGAGWEALLINGILGAAGLALIVPMFVPSRWRGPRTEDDELVASEAGGFLADLKDGRSEDLAPTVSATGATRATRMTRVTRGAPAAAAAPVTRATRIVTGRVSRPPGPRTPRRPDPPVGS